MSIGGFDCADAQMEQLGVYQIGDRYHQRKLDLGNPDPETEKSRALRGQSPERLPAR